MDIGKVSVIIPIYNTEKYVERCVNSIIEQNYKNLEIILVDDGSTDQSYAVCKELQNKDQRIHLYTQKNQGAAQARNTGLDHMHGQYVFFVDSDDFLERNTLDYLAQQMKESNAEIVCCAARTVYELGESKPYTDEGRYVLNTEQALQHCIGRNTIGSIIWGKMYRAELFQDIRFPVGKHSEDEFVSYKLIAKAKIVLCTGEYLYNYFQRSGSMEQSGEPGKYLDFFDAWREREIFLRERGYCELADSTAELIVREAYKRIRTIKDTKRIKIVQKAVDGVGKEIAILQSLKRNVRLKMIVKIVMIHVWFSKMR